MLRLLYFEIRKNYLRKSVLIAFSLFLVINLVLIYKNYVSGNFYLNGYFMPHTADTEKRWEFYHKMHEKMDGTLTDEKADFIVRENNRLMSIVNDGTYSREFQPDSYTGYYWGDFVMVNKYFYNPMKYFATYSVDTDKAVEKAKDNIVFFEKYGNQYEKAKNEFIVNRYANRKVSVFYDSKPWGLLFDYDFSDLLILLLVLLGFIPMFINEKETKMYGLIMSSKKGKINMVFIKLLSAFLFTAFLVFLFSCENIITFKLLYRINGSGMPLYAIEKYQYSPLTCSVGTFYIYAALLKTIGFFSFGMMIFMFSTLFNRVVFTYTFSAFLLLGGVYVSGYIASAEPGKALLSLISPFTLLKGDELFAGLLDINVLNHFFLRPEISILMQILVISVLFLVIGKTTVFKTLKKTKMLPEREELGNGI